MKEFCRENPFIVLILAFVFVALCLFVTGMILDIS